MSGSTILASIDTIAIGNFDGMHLGHRQLFNRLGSHGAVVAIERNSGCLTPGYLRSVYSDFPLFIYHFETISTLSPREFVQRMQRDFPSLKKIVVGYDFRFGHKRCGNVQTLQKEFPDVEVVEEFKKCEIAVHSRQIRELLPKDYDLAVRLLGKPYRIWGEHIKGQGVGAKELVPTINIQSCQCLPKEGVYASKSEVDGKWYDSVSFAGHRKTTDGKVALETHLLDTALTPQRERIAVDFLHYLRPNRKFSSLEALKRQILIDCEAARRYHAKG